jgi:hypothetical protein
MGKSQSDSLSVIPYRSDRGLSTGPFELYRLRSRATRPISKTAREVPMLYSVPFAHSASECPAANKVQMDGIRQILSPENLKPRGIRLVEGYVDRL